MKPKLQFGGTVVSDYCRTMAYIKAGWAGPAWKKHVQQDLCHCCTGIDPDLGEEWWFDPSDTCSRRFLGVLIEDVEYGESYERSVTGTQFGGYVGNRNIQARDIAVTGWIVASSEGGTEYGLEALNSLLAQSDPLTGDCNPRDLNLWAYSAACDPASDACVAQQVTDLEAIINSTDEIPSIIYTDAFGNEYPGCYDGTRAGGIQAVAEACACAGCVNMRTFKRTYARGSVREISTNINRANGTRFEVVFTAETPYKFFAPCQAVQGIVPGPLSYPNWACFNQYIPQDPNLPTVKGEIATGVIPRVTESGETRTYCRPPFVEASASLFYGHKLHESFVNFTLTETGNSGNAQKGISIEVYPHIESIAGDPLTNPEGYAGINPKVIEVVEMPVDGTITYDAGSHTFTATDSGGNSIPAEYYIRGDQLRSVSKQSWVVFKAHAHNDNNLGLTLGVQVQRGAL